MTERERWIVYPLLFLALGASLRDKIIKSTESQRIKCQGLMVYDERSDEIVALFGAQHFPDLRSVNSSASDPGDFIHVDYLRSQAIQADSVRTRALQAENLLAPLWKWWNLLGSQQKKQLQALIRQRQQAAAGPAEDPAGEVATPDPTMSEGAAPPEEATPAELSEQGKRQVSEPNSP